MKIAMLCAVATLMAAALAFPAYGYCRGCVIEPPAARTAMASADADALPLIEPKCHTEKQWHWKNGRKRFKRVEICE